MNLQPLPLHSSARARAGLDLPDLHPYWTDRNSRDLSVLHNKSALWVFLLLLGGTAKKSPHRDYISGQISTHLEYLGFAGADEELKAAIHDALAAWLELRLCESTEKRHRRYRNRRVDWDDHTASVRDRLIRKVRTMRQLQKSRGVERVAPFERDVLRRHGDAEDQPTTEDGEYDAESPRPREPATDRRPGPEFPTLGRLR